MQTGIINKGLKYVLHNYIQCKNIRIQVTYLYKIFKYQTCDNKYLITWRYLLNYMVFKVLNNMRILNLW